MKHVTQFTEGWTLRHEDAALPAAVPGCVHTDLLAAGAIPDPYRGENEHAVAWVARRDWTYANELPAAEGHERADLVFDGLDTVAEIAVGGEVLGSTRNMHRGYRFDVTGLAGDLEVRFTSAYTEAEAQRERLGARPNSYPEPFQYLRKMACSFGWDWGPTLVTAGMWRPVRIERWSTARIAGVRPLVTVASDGGTGRVELRIDVERTASGAGQRLGARARVAGAEAEVRFEGDEAVLVLDVEAPELWWPRGYGEQALYDVELTLVSDDDTPLDTWSRRIGFRTVELHQQPDEHGTGFTLAVNGTPIFARGVNWIPDDALPSRITPERYRTRLEQTAAANVDLVRIWGGGIYEDEAFYDACDELGLLVWQDFPFACAAYPEEQPLRGEVEAEARENVVRLMPHPSLILWNGNNENLWGFRDWEWEPQLAGDSWGEGYYLGLLPRVVAELDPTRPYTAGSPWSGSWDHHPNDPAHGTHHSWDVWNREDYTDYLADVPRFVAEFGWQAPATWATLRRAVGADGLAVDSDAMRHRQKAIDGQEKLARGLARHFTLPDDGDFDRWHYLTQLNQCRAFATGIEHWRGHWPRCAGTVAWQINDCWPVTSWSAIDGDGRPKPFYYELRRLYADRLLTLQPRDGRLAVVADNQGPGEWSATVRLRRLAVDGAVLGEAEVLAAAGPRNVAYAPVPDELLPAAGATKEYLVADADGLRALHFPVRDKGFGYPQAEYEVAVEGSDVVITARTLVRDLVLQADRLAPAAVADTGRVTLLPGERVRIGVRGWERPDVEAARAALFCVNGVRSVNGARS
ncbi:glycoside hydrolase family 2 protein [Streptomyces sp. A7024]|uniref:beta-mannosidase n=1 Tax=Streptomyces coryli TaxID=1128680 RepID=A0A6G4TUV8_9ACTN|nr:glycoside hydrolase family 2 protein [Streptomyces coryli]NGN63320.1 glycoside hydrolase family 2 protein [Streptomyces coryli]